MSRHRRQLHRRHRRAEERFVELLRERDRMADRLLGPLLMPVEWVDREELLRRYPPPRAPGGG